MLSLGGGTALDIKSSLKGSLFAASASIKHAWSMVLEGGENPRRPGRFVGYNASILYIR